MNHIFRTIWSIATQSWQAVSEIAKTAGKKSAKSLQYGALASVVLGLMLSGQAGAQAPPAADQLPTGGTVAHGTATISKSAAEHAASMTVTQTSQRAVVNWESFDLGHSATLNFVQPNSQAVTLNRVNGGNPSQIFGQINANGQIFITNANGVYFAPTASVDVGALVATTHSISDSKFMSGDYVFERNGATGKIVNEGHIRAALGGYVALLAPEVQNAGVVVARAGTVAMAAGDMISLKIEGKGSLAGITTTPSTIATLIENKQAVQAPDGQIILSAVALNKLQAGIIKNSGTLEANSLVSKGGRIYLEGDEITLASTSKIEAKGSTGGGTILVGGDWQGRGDMRQATKVMMEAGAVIDASATQLGDGGKVVLWSDIHNPAGLTVAHGSIKSEAGVSGGNGGQVETSGYFLNVDNIEVSTKAPSGQAGDWLLDPYDIIIAASSPSGTTWASGTVTSGSSTTYTSAAASTILASSINSALASNNVTITTGGTSGDGLGNGDIRIGSEISWSSNNSLTLVAAGQIFGTGGITRTGSGSVTFNQAGNSTGSGYSGVITGTGSVTKTGAGTLLLGGLSTYTGATIVSSGTLKANRGFQSSTSSSPFGFNSPITVAAGATLDAGSYTMQVGSLSGAGTINLGTVVNLASFSFGNDNQSAEFAGVITGTNVISFTKRGTGTQTLSGLNTYLGSTIINAGALKLGRSGDGTGGPLGTKTVSISSGATLDLNGFTGASNQTLSINGSLINSSNSDVTWTGPISGTTQSISAAPGAISLVGSSNTSLGSSGMTISGKVSIGGLISLGTSAIVLSGSGTQLTYAPTSISPSNSLAAPISGTGDLILNPTNPMLVTNVSVNTYSGKFTVAGGVVRAARVENFGASSNSITVNDGGALRLDFTASSASPFSRNITLNGYGNGSYGALDYSSSAGGDFYYSGTVSLGSTTRFSESSNRNLRLTGTIQTNGYNFVDANSPLLVTSGATIAGGGGQRTNSAFVGAYDASGSYSSTYGSSPSIGYQLYTSAAAASTTSVADVSGTAQFTANGSTLSATSSVGSYSLAYGSGLSSSTHALFPITTKTNWTVNKAPLTVTATAASKLYDGSGYSGGNGVSYSGFVNSETSAVLGGSISYSGTSQGAIDAGSYVITPTGLTSNNYDISYTHGALTINKAPLTVTATAASKTYDGAAYSGGNGVSYSGFVNSETSSVLTGSLGYSGTSQGAIAVGSYVITPSGLTGTNYDITYTSGALTITAAAASSASSGSSSAASSVRSSASTATNTNTNTTQSGSYNFQDLVTGALTMNRVQSIAAANDLPIIKVAANLSANNTLPLLANNQTSATAANGITTVVGEVTTVSELDSLAANNSKFLKQANSSLTINTPIPSSSTRNLAGTTNKVVDDLGKPAVTSANAQQNIEPSVRPLQSLALSTKPAIDSITAKLEVAATPRPQSGILAVTVVEGPGVGVKSNSVSFEQKADAISLESSSTPVTPVAADKLEFSGKLTTFVVGAPNGKTVEYQGGLVNNHIVIAATSDEAKNVARADTKLVLAPAVTTLGRGDQIQLAQLDGVIIDLR